ncbi:hemerythrin domain-containing protein [Geodermatophilus sabuli]|uniref:Hemerythrin HHE cation binding domain-containing protein n=1 Tax=Geodermatophilus sabuli TaxID=1564158 RepID=A0A285EIR2_9ACTN|nr:hemerythrin domain-containing protein [Geodermatophilus sabuli]MBB3085771.1 hypothetical protein [Geodermatophilus sabuli]SNX99018.1 Hemerythrin HHE cation binding domain-containing protein [Geodermatophilus sabuli]
MSTPTDVRRQLHLPGQAAVAEGPHDLSGMYVMHHAFRRDLGRFATAVRRTPLDDVAAWRALSARWHRFASVLHHHHTIEDTALWPVLLASVDAAGDPAARATLEAMAAEHELIDPLLESCATGFTAMAYAPDAAARDRLAGRVDAAFGEGGRAFRVLLRLTRGRFERAERAAFRHA